MKNVLIFDLGRAGGCPHYASMIVEKLSFSGCKYFVSSKRVNRGADIKKTILPMYKGVIGFFFASITILPFLLVSLLFLRINYKSIYFPYFHYWSVPIMLFARLLGYRVISTIHDGIPHSGDGKFLEKQLNKYYALLSGSLIFLTSSVKRDMLRVYPELSKKEISVIPHGIIPVQGYQASVRNKSLSESSLVRVLFFGRVLKYKGVELLPEMCEYLEDRGINIEVVIAGKWGYPIPSRIHEKKNIRIINEFIDENEVGRIFSAADILVMPYIEATQSGVASLAIYAETPIVYTDVGGLKEQVQGCGYLVSPNSHSIADGVYQVCMDEGVYKSIQDKMRDMKVMLSWDNIARQVYEKF